MVAQARTFLEAWPDIALSISGRSLITWNAAFDARMLVQTATLHKIVLKDIDFHCCMQEYARYYNFARWQSLTAACSQQRIAFNTNHRALGDCFMVLDIIRAIAEKARPVSDPSVTLETKARFQSSDLVPLDLKNWDGVRKALEG
jgi:DNA polymerase III epsilon subunit-like protein